MKITNEELAEYSGVNESVIRYWKDKKISLYENTLEDYKKSLNIGQVQSKVIMVTSFKGGVGKSTVCNLLGADVKDSVIFNIDIGANAGSVNSTQTIDFGEFYEDNPDFNIGEVITALKDEYKTIIIDTAGDLTEEMISAIDYVDDFIILFEDGKRAMNTSIETFKNLFFMNDLVKGNHKAVLVINKITEEKEMDNLKREIENIFKINTLNKNLNLEVGYSYLKYSLAVKTMENEKLNIADLYTKNKIAYRIFKSRAEKLTKDIKNFLVIES